MASGSTPISGLPYPSGQDSFALRLDMQALATALDSKLVLSFASASERSQKAPSAQDGAWCFLRDVRRYETYSAVAGAWTWPDWAQGVLARAEYVDTNNTPPEPGRTPLSSTPNGLPAFNVAVPNLPAGRQIRVTFSGMISADNACNYGFVLVFAGVQRRGGVPIIWGADAPENFHISYVFTTSTSFPSATGGVQTGAILAGSGPAYLHSTGFDGPTQFVIEDLGGA